ncbi:MAG TPA: condensin subunit MukF [Polyangiaceae bacterium]|nr:condensin subunit MukF [Polyangiaceae bacterium]
MSEPAPNPQLVLAALARSHPVLELGTLDLCFLAALHLQAEGATLSAFSEEKLSEVFEQACAIVEPRADNLKRRATHAIQRLRDQKLLARVDGAGVLRAGEFALTRLAASIVESYLADESLTRENLTQLTHSLRISLAEILTRAGVAQTAEDWRSAVEGPLRVSVSDLVSGIERRQRSLDLEQQAFQIRIAKLLESDWFGAVDQCLELLETTSRTLTELNEILLRDAHELSSVLQDIQEVTVTARAEGAEAAVERVMEQVDRIRAWGAARQRAWSEYYQYVHRYLCDVVRLDPSRALIQRLREQLSQHTSRPFALSVAAAAAPRLLREIEPFKDDKPKVSRPRAERERPPSDSDTIDQHAIVEELVQGALTRAPVGLSEVTRQVNAETPSELQFVTAGRVAQVVARLARTTVDRDRPWVSVNDGLVIEEWKLANGGARD